MALPSRLPLLCVAAATVDASECTDAAVTLFSVDHCFT